MAPRVGFEPTTLRLTAGCSTVELSRNKVCPIDKSYYSWIFGLCQLPVANNDENLIQYSPLVFYCVKGGVVCAEL